MTRNDKAGNGQPNPQNPATQDSISVADTGSAAQDPPKIIKPRRGTVFIMIGVALAGILAILYAWQFWPFNSAITTTENAYVRGQITVMAPQVNGYVAKVLVRDFEAVRRGQTLLQIDDRIYRQRVEQAQADLDARKAELDNSVQTQASDQATLTSRGAELNSAQAEYARAQADELRVNELASRGSVSVREGDQIRATARAASANVKKARAAINIAEETVKSTRVSRGVLQAQVRTAQAALHLAEIDLDNTQIRAPRDGVLSEVSVRLGQYVSAGSQLLYLVPEQLWVIANYKETQIHHMLVGQPVSLDVDALDGARLTGRLERLAPATGSEFSVLRPDNATGNFTKVAQRIPVRIVLDPEQPLLHRLRPGMSVITHVDTSDTSKRSSAP